MKFNPLIISLKNLIPKPLAELGSLQSSVWLSELSFQPQTYYQLHAPSGKGKSTLIHILYGLRKDYSGEVLFDNQPISTMLFSDWTTLRQQSLSIVFQDLRLFPNLTALENIQLKASLYPENQSIHIQECAELLGIAHLLNHPAETLSYGERQRVAIIRALVQPFQWLLLDEPFSHLDSKNIEIASQLIEKEVNKKKAGIILTSLGFDYPLPIHQKLTL